MKPSEWLLSKSRANLIYRDSGYSDNIKIKIDVADTAVLGSMDFAIFTYMGQVFTSDGIRGGYASYKVRDLWYRPVMKYVGKAMNVTNKLSGGVKMFERIGGKGVMAMILAGVVGIMLLILIPMSIYTVGPGMRGVVTTWGKVSNENLGEGLHFVMPIAQKVIKVDTKIYKSETVASAASKDVQEVHAKIALNYHVSPGKAHVLFQTVGVDFKERIIDPSVQEAFKAITARYVAADLIQKREHVSAETKDLLKLKLLEYNIIVDGFNTVDFGFSKNFTESVEAKQVAEQKALQAKNDLERIKTEAQQKIESAKAEAESLRLQKQNVSQELIELRKVEANIMAIKKWDGKLPDVVGGAMPFVNVTPGK